jgi:putative transposase
MLKCLSQTFRFRLELTPDQCRQFSSWAGTCRFLFNLALEHRKMNWDNQRKNITYFDQANSLKDIKKVEGYDWIKETPAQLLQQSLKDLDRAYNNFFKFNQTLGRGFPSYKRKGEKDSFRFPDPKQFFINIINKKWNTVKLPKIGNVKFKNTRDILGKIRNATITRRGKHWYINFNCEVEKNIPENTGAMVGIDRGINKTICLSSDTTYNLPSEIKDIEKRISYLQKKLRLKKKFSFNSKKLKNKIAKYHRKISEIRNNWLHKVSNIIAKNHSFVVMENLNIKNMSHSAKGTMEIPGNNVSAKSGLNRSILRQGWYKFEVYLNYKCEWWGSNLELVNPKNTSIQCSKCGFCSKENRQSQEIFNCINCNHLENADIHAAKNILSRGRREQVCGGARVTLACEAETTILI